jgi:ribosomal protein L37E
VPYNRHSHAAVLYNTYNSTQCAHQVNEVKCNVYNLQKKPCPVCDSSYANYQQQRALEWQMKSTYQWIGPENYDIGICPS